MSFNNINSEVRFGVAGFPLTFLNSDYRKKRENIFMWLKEIGLNWIELQNTYGVKMKDEQAHIYRELAEKFQIGISIHAPYYITLASADEDVVSRSKERILQCYELAIKLNSKRIIFHPGHFPGKSIEERQEALEKIIYELNSLKSHLPAKDIFLYPETAGKKSQIGSVSDIIAICKQVDYTRPCIDVAHVHGFENGSLTSQQSILDILQKIESELGRDILKQTHFHMYPVEVDHNGEKKHKAFDDIIECPQLSLFDTELKNRYYPLPEDFIGAIKMKNLTPVVVCEARDSQDYGAQLMKKLYEGGE